MLRRILVVMSLPLACFLMSSTIDLNDLFNYADQPIPEYIQRDNTVDNAITDAGATLGRVLFYDKNLSANLSVSCSSCHLQTFGFGDPLVQSIGFDGGLTGRHSMRLINTRFGTEGRFFWDKRANSLEEQVTRPIQDHIEMGFSGAEGTLDFDDLIERLEGLTYYQDLFTFVYGDAEVTEERIQLALAQFIRSIQSFDSRFDEGRAQANNNAQPFANFTPQENLGKQLFLAPTQNGGGGCANCHQPPEFSINNNSRNNGIIGVIGSDDETDLSNTRAPSLRDLVNPMGVLNGPLMHTGEFNSLLEVIEHYDNGIELNEEIDNRLLGPDGAPQQLGFTTNEKAALVAFLESLTGTTVYSDERWSDPFGPNGELDVLSGPVANEEPAIDNDDLVVFPNPASDQLNIRVEGEYRAYLMDANGRQLRQQWFRGQTVIDVSDLSAGLYLLRCEGDNGDLVKRVVLQ
ncbi:cytochrome-c peroxidase [Lewinellaceae bacterium SD302]|nr:cytochrome-c peroxidase [Lewinellaceae bacterium SD302]